MNRQVGGRGDFIASSELLSQLECCDPPHHARVVSDADIPPIAMMTRRGGEALASEPPASGFAAGDESICPSKPAPYCAILPALLLPHVVRG